MRKQVRAHIFVSGLVQGVFFRARTRRKAQELGIKGWVRNLPDGRLEAVFEGEEERVREMLKWAQNGPPGAQISDFQAKWEEYEEEFENFEVRY